jgi:uncharacterized protein
MNKGERISRMVEELVGQGAPPPGGEIVHHPFYRAYFRYWNDQRYHEAHDVLEQVWLATHSNDSDFFKGLIQAAGSFFHLQKNFEHPTHAKHSARLRPAARLFLMAENNLARYAPTHHGLDVAALVKLLREQRQTLVGSHYQVNPWSPETAPKLKLR